MPAVSRAQQKFFGIVRAIQKGEQSPTTPETAKVAADMKKSDVKDFASTKHKGLPEKKVKKEETNYKSKDKILKKVKPLHKHLYKNLHKGDTSGDVNEGSKYDKYDKEKKKFAKADTRMKFGKFYGKAKEARDRLRPGEVKRYDKKLGKYVSNKD